MVRTTLVIGPHTGWVGEIQLYEGVDVLVLDDLLMAGLAGVYFRRLRVMAAMHPVMRTEYDKKRHLYLSAVLSELTLQDDVVVVGTHPTDVDLLDFDRVCAVRVSDPGMREMSTKVYGDPVMLYVEYMSVLRAIGDAVDDWYHVVSWREITMLIMRHFPKRVHVSVNLSPSKQRSHLAALLVGESDAAVWLEDDLRLDLPMGRHFLIADYDYLSVIRPKWRDAVVRLLDRAPAIEEVFRLPWYLVEPVALNTLCFRANVHGMPAVSMRGRSLVEFVRTRLATVFTTRELAGTWIGGLLADDVTAVDTIASLGVEPVVAVDSRGQRNDVSDKYAVWVPSEYAWMYEAVRDVRVVRWDGPRRVDGMPRVDAAQFPWAASLPLAALYESSHADQDMSAAVVQLFQRLHSVGVDPVFLRDLTNHASDVMNEGPTDGVFDPGLTPLLPGYNYAYCFVPSVRYAVLEELGRAPPLPLVLEYASHMVSGDGTVSVDALYADACRAMVLAGRTVQMLYPSLMVGHKPSHPRPGYCYECMFQPVYRVEVRKILGPYPTLADVMQRKLSSWYIRDALTRVHVTCAPPIGPGEPWMLHFTLKQQGFLLRELLYAIDSREDAMVALLVGDTLGAADVCYGAGWYVAAIIAWTIVGVVGLGVLVWLLYMRLSRGRSGGYSRR